jgi:hypothetical protein
MASIELDIEYQLIADIEIDPDDLAFHEDGVREPRVRDYGVGEIASDETAILEPATRKIGLGEVAMLETAVVIFLPRYAALGYIGLTQCLILAGISIEQVLATFCIFMQESISFYEILFYQSNRLAKTGKPIVYLFLWPMTPTSFLPIYQR